MRTSKPGFEPGTLNPYSISGSEIQPGDLYGYKVVLGIDEGYQSFRAYRGPTAWDDKHVLSNGDQVCREVVEALFPTIYHTLIDQGYIYTA